MSKMDHRNKVLPTQILGKKIIFLQCIWFNLSLLKATNLSNFAKSHN